MSEPAPTAETRVEWEATDEGVARCLSSIRKHDTPAMREGVVKLIVNGRKKYMQDLRASVNGGPARTPGEWLTVMDEIAREWIVTANGYRPFGEALEALRDLLGDG